MANEADELLALETGFWTGDEAYFKQHADKECLVAFGERMAGIMTNSELAATARDPNRWHDLKMDLKGIVRPAEDVAILSYLAAATRESGEPYRALISTGYVRRSDGWKMVFHQHAPV